MIPELGHYALMLALGLALIQGTMPILGTRTNDPVLMSMAAPTALAQFAFVAMAFTALATCYVTFDFSEHQFGCENQDQNGAGERPTSSSDQRAQV
jgi:cytochrome c-type biogenesis protein CcmF